MPTKKWRLPPQSRKPAVQATSALSACCLKPLAFPALSRFDPNQCTRSNSIGQFSAIPGCTQVHERAIVIEYPGTEPLKVHDEHAIRENLAIARSKLRRWRHTRC